MSYIAANDFKEFFIMVSQIYGPLEIKFIWILLAMNLLFKALLLYIY